MTRERRARALLALGATAGLAAAVATLVGGPALPVSADAVAVVNGVPIRRDDYLRALAGVASIGGRRSTTPTSTASSTA